MKYAIILLSLIFLFVFAGILPVTGNAPVAQKGSPLRPVSGIPPTAPFRKNPCAITG
jgi:hypothetical protein